MFELLFSFEGRIGRLSYWMGSLAPALMAWGGAFLVTTVDPQRVDDPTVLWTFAGLMIVLVITMVWMTFAIQAKRWHDRNKSAWWILIGFIPVIGIWALIENGFLAGDDGSNDYGPPPPPFGTGSWQEEAVAPSMPADRMVPAPSTVVRTATADPWQPRAAVDTFPRKEFGRRRPT